MNDQLEKSFIKTYGDKNYKHTAMVNHRGTVVAFAMDDKRKIYYTVLDMSEENKSKGTLDANYWSDNPRSLTFPREIEQVGYSLLNAVPMPTVKKGTRVEDETNKISQQEIDNFLSSTARLTADAPFQAFSDNRHIYIFRQAIAGDHSDIVYKTKSGTASAAAKDQTLYVTNNSNEKVPIVSDTLLVDRFILAGNKLKLPREVRFRRSENKSRPASAKDSLGAKDMVGNPFYEPTKELDFVGQLKDGCFSVVMLPSAVADVERWQIFAYNKVTRLIDTYNIERGENGFFNTKGTQLYTSPDEEYRSSVLERNPGNCPFTGRELVPVDGSSPDAERAIRFSNNSDLINLGNPTSLQITGDQTIEMWLKPDTLKQRQNPFDKAYGGEGAITLEPAGQLNYYYGTSGDWDAPYQSFQTTRNIPAHVWTHIAIVRDLTNQKLHWYINGVPSGEQSAKYLAAVVSDKIARIGYGYAGAFIGMIDEVRVWSRALSQAEIESTMHKRLVGSETGLAGYWRLDEGSGNEVADLSSHANDGTIQTSDINKIWVLSDAPIGKQRGVRRTSFALGDREVEGGLAARLYYEQQKLTNDQDDKPVKQNARVLLTAVTQGVDVNPPVTDGLALFVTGESFYGGNQWDDLSGNGNHAYTAYGSPMPSIQSEVNNGKSVSYMHFSNGPSMRFNQLQPGGSPIAEGTSFTAIIIDRYSHYVGDKNSRTLFATGAYAGNPMYMQPLWVLGSQEGNTGFRIGNSRKFPNNADTVYPRSDVGKIEPAQADVFKISTATLDGQTQKPTANFYINGVSQGSAEIDAGSLSFQGLGLGNNGISADVACVLIWDRMLTETERQTVEKWLGYRYGIGVSHSEDLLSSTSKYIATVDISVSQTGHLAQLPSTIPLATLLTPDPGGEASSSVIEEIASLDNTLPLLKAEIEAIDVEITAISQKIQRLETEVSSIATVNNEISRLEKSLKSYKAPRYASFYEHRDQGGASFKMKTGDSNASLTGWHDKISSISYSPSLKIECFEHSNYGGKRWVFPGETGKSWNDNISSIKIHEGDALRNNREATEKSLKGKRTKLSGLETKRDSDLPAERMRLSNKQALKLSKQSEYKVKSNRRVELFKRRFGTPPAITMIQCHTDPQGLAISSGLLGFAFTDAQPTLLDSALGRMMMFFKGVNGQFFASYYDVNTSRAQWTLAASSSNLTLSSGTSDSWNNDTMVSVSNDADSAHCKVVVENRGVGTIETWRDVPREAQVFAQVLNGEAAEKIFIGNLKTPLTGDNTDTIELQSAFSRQVPARSLLIIEDSSTTPARIVKLIVRKTQDSGKNQLVVNAASPIAAENASVYFMRYDYAQATINRPDSNLGKGTLSLVVSVGDASGNVTNGSATLIEEAISPRWVADAPGSALAFNGQSQYLSGETATDFEHEGDMTLEAWIKPNRVSSDTSLIHAKTSNNHYALGLRKANTALYFDGSDDYIDLGNSESLQITSNQTIEMWIKPKNLGSRQNPISKAYDGEGTITLEDNGLLSYYYGVLGTNKGNTSEDYHYIQSTQSLAENRWSHIAIVRDFTNKTLTWYINGKKNHSAKAKFSSAVAGNQSMIIGKGYAGSFSGWIDEIRIWNVARSADEIETNWHRQITEPELGLVGRYHFADYSGQDRSDNGNNGTLLGGLASSSLTESPLSMYTCFATVGGNAIETTVPIGAGSWQHLAAVFNQSYALKFDGNDFGDAGNEAMLNITEDLTIEAFIQVESLGRKNGILSKGFIDGGAEGSVPYAFYINESGRLVLTFEGEDGTNYRYTSSHSIPVNKPTRVAVVRKIGKEKVEKKGTKKIVYEEIKEGAKADKDGNYEVVTKEHVIEVIESVEFTEHSDIRFYINSTERGRGRHTGQKPIGNNGSLYLGCSYLARREKAQFQGVMSEIRIWNRALGSAEVNSNLAGTEAGLMAWWRMEENDGNVAYDAKAGNHARLSGATWVKNPDPKGSSFVIYHNGQLTAKRSMKRLSIGLNQFTMGAKKGSGSTYSNYFSGYIEEVRIWKTARRHEEILDNIFTRLKGEKADLIANYSFDEIKNNEVKDAGLKSNHLAMPTVDDQRPTLVLSTAPISNDTAQVRSALAGIKTDFHETISGRPSVIEYADSQRFPDGSLVGVFKRCYAYDQNGKWVLSTGYKVGSLITEWIGQAQFDPQVVGYIEGAPPVPSENLTEGFYRIVQTFSGTSQVTLEESEKVNYTISTSREDSFMTGFELDAELGIKADPIMVAAPMGFGVAKKLKFEATSNFKLGMDTTGSWSGGESYKSGQNITRKMTAKIGGSWEVDEKDKWANPELTRRFVPKNTGFAFVESETADIYALRLEHTGTLVAFRILPNPDIPKDTNIISFPINNRYTKQGTLDGRLGYTSSGIVYDPDYKNTAGYGEYSYFKPKEAYQLKKRIEREEQRLKEFYSNFNTNPAGASLMRGAAQGIGSVGGLAGGLIGAEVAKTLGLAAGGSTIAPILAGTMLAAGFGTTIASAVDSDRFDNNLAEKYARRNLVNTYVWTANGGFFEESTQISQVRSTSTSGSYKFNGKGTGGFKIGTNAAFKSKFALNGILGGGFNLAKSKSEEAENSFKIDMKLMVPGNLQKYEYKTPGDLSSGVRPVYENGQPVIQPGKVDAFRFMTFYLEPQLTNFEDLFGKVIDPIWLKESNHPNAIALRQANQANKKPKCWRVFHRVTFVSRILPDFPTSSAPPLEKKMKDLNIASNYELVRRLDPFVKDKTADWVEFKDAVKSAVETYLSELSGEADLYQITLFLADYYGVEY